MDDLLVENGSVLGVQVSDSRDGTNINSEGLIYDAVVLAVGHSARDVYHMLLSHGIDFVPKDFAVSAKSTFFICISWSMINQRLFYIVLIQN